MSTSPQRPAGQGPTGRDRFDSFIASLRRIGIWRTDDRWFGGVAAGLAHRLRVDPLIVRAGFILAALMGGLGLVLYGLGWLLLPEARDGRIHLQEASRGQVEAGLVGAGITIVLGLGGTPTLLGIFGGWGILGFPFGIILTVALLVALAVVVFSRKDRPAGQVPSGNNSFPTSGPFAPATTPSGGQPFRGGPTDGPTMASAMPTQSGPIVSTGSLPPQPPNDSLTHPTSLATPTHCGPSATTGPVPPQPPYGSPTRPIGHATPLQPPYGPPARPTTYAAPVPPVPMRPVRRGAGGAVAGTVAALTLFIIAGLMLIDRYTNVLHGTFVPGLGTGAIFIMAGLVIIVLGVLGRRAGGLTAFVILATVFLLPSLIILHVATNNPAGLDIGTHHWQPTSTNQTERSYSVGIGQGKLDLGNLTNPAEPRTIDFNVGVGDAILTLPRDVPTKVDATVNVGTVIGELPDGWRVEWNGRAVVGRSSSDEITNNGLYINENGFEVNSRWDSGTGGIGISATIKSPEVVAGAEPSLTINATNTIGRLLIREGN